MEEFKSIRAHAVATARDDVVEIVDECGQSNDPPAKKQKLTSLERLRNSRKKTSAPTESYNEVEAYLKLDPDSFNQSDCPLQFWKQNASRFPSLSSIAFSYLSTPASSGSVERLFSVAGAVARVRRARLTTMKLEQLLMCRKWARNKTLSFKEADREIQWEDLEPKNVEGFTDDEEDTDDDERRSTIPRLGILRQ